MRKNQVMSIVRHTLTFVGGLLVAKGTLDEGTAHELGGAVVTVAGILWGLFDKKDRP